LNFLAFKLRQAEFEMTSDSQSTNNRKTDLLREFVDDNGQPTPISKDQLADSMKNAGIEFFEGDLDNYLTKAKLLLKKFFSMQE